MNELTKRYRIIYKGKKLLSPLEEYPKKSTTYVGKGYKSFETDDLNEAKQYIKDNGLVYEEIV